MLTRRHFLTRQALGELALLQRLVRTLAARRGAALRRLLTSRYAATPLAQGEFWAEFTWVDAEYRWAVRRLAQFCLSRAPASAPDGSGLVA